MFITTFLSYFIPARGVVRKVLSGNFDGLEFQYFYYQYKKSHYLKPSYLAWRQLMTLKKKVVIKVFLLSIASLFILRITGDIIIDNISYDEVQEIPTVNCFLEQEQFKQFDFNGFKSYIKQILQYQLFNNNERLL